MITTEDRDYIFSVLSLNNASLTKQHNNDDTKDLQVNTITTLRNTFSKDLSLL